jgi:PAS domain S-box-containing protein
LAEDRRTLWLAAAMAAEIGLLVLDIASGERFLARGLYLVPVLALAIFAAPAQVAAVAGFAVAITALSPIWNETGGDEYVVPLAVTTAGSVIAVLAARAREAAEAARAQVEAERAQLRLLADAARITDGAADIEEALARLADLLVPDLADAAWIDVVARDGQLRRLVTRAHGPHAAEIEEWVKRRGASRRMELSPTSRALRGEGAQLAELTPDLREAMISDAEDRRHFERSGLRWTMAFPLAPSGGPLGALGVALGHSGRRYGPDDLAFGKLLVGRAGLALANAQLVNRLTATQRRLDGILGALAEAVTVHDARGRMVYANDAAAALLGLPGVHAVLTAPSAELVDRFDIRHPDGRPVSQDELPGARIIRGETPEPMLTQSVRRSTGELHWFLTKATALEDEDGGILAVNVIEDVTEQHEAALRQRFLAEAGEALGSSLDLEDTLRSVARLAVPRLADWCAIELPDDRGELQQVALVHVDPARVDLGYRLRERYPPDPDAPIGTHAVMRSGEVQLIEEVPDEMLVAAAGDAEHLALARSLGLRSLMIMPMITGGRTLGVMSFVFAESGRRYTADDIGFAQELAGRAAVAVENARLYTELSDVAQTLQASLLPEALPAVDGWRFAADYRPGQQGADVGGDFYDIFPVEDGNVVLLGDVTGKGVAAAALTSLVRHTAKTAAMFDARPTSVLAVVNRALRQRPRLAPVTMICGVLRGARLTFAVGGHPLPLLKRGDEPSRKVGASGLLLGAVEQYDGAHDVELPLERGDIVVLYTDGVTDTPGAGGRFGEDRLRAAVDAAAPEPEAVIASISRAVEDYAVGGGLDDRAILVVQRLAAA